MKTKRILSVIAVILAAMLMFACNSNAGSYEPDYSSDKGGNYAPESGIGESSLGVDSTSRKIIFSYSCSIYTDDLETSIKALLDPLADFSDAYVESSSKTSNEYNKRAEYRLRIRSEDLNAYIESIKTAGEFTDESLSSDDVTKNYFDLESAKAAKEAELSRLMELYAKASTISELTSIGQRISNVQAELNSINSSLKNYDSLVALSTVNINIYQSTPPAPPAKETFGTKLLSVLKGTGKAVAVFFEYILYFIIYVAPFAAIGGGIIFLVFYTRKKSRAKKSAATPPPDKTPKDD